MKALTLTQPWASLVALKRKRIETRSWKTSYRGPLAIHAAKGLPAGRRSTELTLGPFTATKDKAGMILRGPISHPYRLPRSAVVATANLVDVVPVELLRWSDHTAVGMVDGWWSYGAKVGEPWAANPEGIYGADEHQRPFGDFSPGRYAWLLGDIEPVRQTEAVSNVKGALGLWEWERPA